MAAKNAHQDLHALHLERLNAQLESTVWEIKARNA
jgi:hypothetical protein